MLILVAVTVNLANENGGLFEKARYAKSETATKAEEEELTMYMYGEGVYNAKTGEVDLDALGDLLTDGAKWKNVSKNGDKLVVTGTKSGKGYIIDEKGTISEQKDGEGQSSTEIVGKKFYVTGENTEYSDYMQFNSDFSGKAIVYNRDNPTQVGESDSTTFKYTYDSVTKKGEIKLHYEEDGESWDETMEFDYVSIKDESGNEVNQAIVFGGSVDCHVYATNKNDGLTPLGNNVYANGDKTIEFGTTDKNGITYGTCVVKENGTILDSADSYYTCCNGYIYGSDYLDNATINSDYTEITFDSTVYTKQ